MEQALEIKSVMPVQMFRIETNEGSWKCSYIRDEYGNWTRDSNSHFSPIENEIELEEAYHKHLKKQNTECDVFMLTECMARLYNPNSYEGVFLTADEACDYAKSLHCEEYIVEDDRHKMGSDYFHMSFVLDGFCDSYSVEKINITLSKLRRMLEEVNREQRDYWSKEADDKIDQINKIIKTKFNN